MGNRPKDIQNEIAYFYAVVKNMDLNDSIKQSKIRSHEISLDETKSIKENANKFYKLYNKSKNSSLKLHELEEKTLKDIRINLKK